MDDAARLLERLRRIEGLTLDGAGRPGELLTELRALVPEAEAWARVEGDTRAVAAVSKLRKEAEGMP
ncbi:MAG TPA: hypothetical protein VGP69_08740 [Gaiellaceae bacterium]|jgi:hypothetical protein|nr:hypothetical protein [Gaiellaceae bacterium]